MYSALGAWRGIQLPAEDATVNVLAVNARCCWVCVIHKVVWLGSEVSPVSVLFELEGSAQCNCVAVELEPWVNHAGREKGKVYSFAMIEEV